MDQGDEATVLAVRDRILAEQGHIDVLINNAVSRPMRNWSDPLEKFAESMRVNATGVFCVTRAMGDAMAERGRGSILNIGSIQGHVGPDGDLYNDLAFHGFVPDYFFHKGGMINFTRFVASYYGDQGVRCNCISPGGFYNNHDPRFVERYAAKTVLGRMADDTDLKGAIVFFASEASRYVTGADLPIDGGYTAK
jgi:NAD(P)-dependent dehydrogenase (short-subunit alcohol dehydrogenase family)